MQYIYFYREDNNFEDILKDPAIKKHTKYKSKWLKWLLIGVADAGSIVSYINIKYGNDIKTDVHADFTPIAGKDYVVQK